MTEQLPTAITNAAPSTRMQDNSSEPRKKLRADIGGK